jgi:hypothetical protein
MRKVILPAVVLLLLFGVSCSEQKAAEQAAPAMETTPQAAATEVPAAPEPTATPAEEASPEPESAATPGEDPPETAKAAETPAPDRIEVEATKPGLTRVGTKMCKLCHRLQYESWEKTAHAKLTPPLDCESCHGPGSEYDKISVMTDAEKAKAAGLVIPTKAFCTTNCHKTVWKDDFLARAHAHKPKE